MLWNIFSFQDEMSLNIYEIHICIPVHIQIHQNIWNDSHLLVDIYRPQASHFILQRQKRTSGGYSAQGWTSVCVYRWAKQCQTRRAETSATSIHTVPDSLPLFGSRPLRFTINVSVQESEFHSPWLQTVNYSFSPTLCHNVWGGTSV